MPDSSGSIRAAMTPAPATDDQLVTSVQDSMRPAEGSATSAHDLVALAHSVPVTLRVGGFRGAFPVHVASPASGLNAHASMLLPIAALPMAALEGRGV